MSEGEVGTFRALFSRPVAFDPYVHTIKNIKGKFLVSFEMPLFSFPIAPVVTN